MIWEGAPLPGIRDRGRLVFLSLFGVPFLVLGLAGTGVGLRHAVWLGQWGLGLFTLAIGLIFLLLGYTLVFHQWVEAARAHRTTRYALTTRTAYILRASHRQTLEAYPIQPDTALELVRGEGYDNLWFHTRRERDSDGDLSTTRIGFEGIKDGAEVYRLMRGIQTGTT
ncbi:MAG: hypothetical protein MUE52_12650 [Tabrizicola sp.]|nr:hypothetical protein [Tabrizicola sp.]